MTDQDTEQDLSPAEEVDEGVPSANVDELDQEIETQSTDATDDEPAQDDEPVVPIEVPDQAPDDQARIVDRTPLMPVVRPDDGDQATDEALRTFGHQAPDAD
jgi:hypothetical protein